VLDCAAFLAERAEDAGLRVTRYAAGPGKVNVVARGGPAGVGGLLLSGHMDVVPVDGQPWTSDPFTLTERGDQLFARGACDMKGFIAAVDTALTDLDLRTLEQELCLVWTCDEEVGCQGAAKLVEQLEAEGGALPTAAVIGEPTDFRIVRMHPGHCTFEVTVHGQAAHSSRPSLGANAIEGAARVVLALEDLAAEWARDRAFEDELPTPHAILSVGTIRGGAAVNIVPDRCTVQVGVRQLPGQPVDAVEAELRARVAEVAERVAPRGLRVELARVQAAPALHTPSDCGHLHLLQPWASDPTPTGVPFATDGGPLAALGVETLVFGPGSIDVAHRADEHVPLPDLVRTIDVVRDLVRRRCLVRRDAAPAAR
jgi:acetylornithine deacetylase